MVCTKDNSFCAYLNYSVYCTHTLQNYKCYYTKLQIVLATNNYTKLQINYAHMQHTQNNNGYTSLYALIKIHY